MPGPKSEPEGGKTKRDHESGKWARRLVNRHADPIRESGGQEDVLRMRQGRSKTK